MSFDSTLLRDKENQFDDYLKQRLRDILCLSNI